MITLPNKEEKRKVYLQYDEKLYAVTDYQEPRGDELILVVEALPAYHLAGDNFWQKKRPQLYRRALLIEELPQALPFKTYVELPDENGQPRVLDFYLVEGEDIVPTNTFVLNCDHEMMFDL